MSKLKEWIQISQPEGVISLDIQDFCKIGARTSSSPIDHYYQYVSQLLPLGTEQGLKDNEILGRLLVLGLVSGVELYFRSILTRIIQICPICRDEYASDQLLSLGALHYYGIDNIGYGLLEGASLSSAGELKKRTNRLLGLKWQKDSSVDSAMTEFEKVCQLRHAAVHAQGQIGQSNARNLKLGKSGEPHALSINLKQLHQAAGICHNSVRAYNKFLYQELIERWIGRFILKGTWSNDEKLFAPLFTLFYSKEDLVGTKTARENYEALLPAIVKRLA